MHQSETYPIYRVSDRKHEIELCKVCDSNSTFFCIRCFLGLHLSAHLRTWIPDARGSHARICHPGRISEYTFLSFVYFKNTDLIHETITSLRLLFVSDMRDADLPLVFIVSPRKKIHRKSENILRKYMISLVFMRGFLVWTSVSVRFFSIRGFSL